jgi:ligand-binding sensor domain-containing protein
MMLDNDGFLWFVTNQGIWRFDGTDVQPVDIHNAALPQNSKPDNIYRYHNILFFTLLDIPTDTYRVLYYYFDRRKLVQFNMSGRPFNFSIDKTGALTFMTANGCKWIFTENYGLKETEKFYTYPGWVKGEGMENATIDSNGDVYVFSHQKVGLIQNKKVTWTRPIEADKRFSYVRRAYITSKYIDVMYDNGLVVYEKNGLKRVFENFGRTYELSLPSKNGLLPVYQGINDSRVQCMFPEPQGNKVLVGTDNGLLEIAPDMAKPDETARQQQVVNFFKNKSIRSIYRASNNKLYVGTYQGFFVYDGYSFKQVSTYIAYTIEPVGDNMLLAGLEGGNGFFLLDTRTDIGHLNSYKNGTIGATKILKFENGYLAGAFNYIYYLTALPGGDYKITPFLKDPKLGIIKDLKFFKNELWIASTEGIFKITEAGKKIKIYPSGNI